MSVLKCKMCGAPLNYDGISTVVECEYCFSQQTIPKADDEKKITLYDRANFYRSKKEFDKALLVYEGILTEYPNEAEAHWGVCLCRYGIVYVQDPRTDKRIPTCHRTQFESILANEDYLAAIVNADLSAKKIYEEEAKYIDSVQKGILEISSQEEPFDIFICYKESDDSGNRTVDSVLAHEIFDAFTQKGYKVFFSRVTLEDKLGTTYEPYIFAALNSARIMLAIGTKTEYFDAVWVKNEWSRYLALIEQNRNKTLIPCYRDLSPYDMPEVFATLQSQDMSKLGWLQDLVRGVEKILGVKKASDYVSEKEIEDAIKKEKYKRELELTEYEKRKREYEWINKYPTEYVRRELMSRNSDAFEHYKVLINNMKKHIEHGPFGWFSCFINALLVVLGAVAVVSGILSITYPEYSIINIKTPLDHVIFEFPLITSLGLICVSINLCYYMVYAYPDDIPSNPKELKLSLGNYFSELPAGLLISVLVLIVANIIYGLLGMFGGILICGVMVLVSLGVSITCIYEGICHSLKHSRKFKIAFKEYYDYRTNVIEPQCNAIKQEADVIYDEIGDISWTMFDIFLGMKR